MNLGILVHTYFLLLFGYFSVGTHLFRKIGNHLILFQKTYRQPNHNFILEGRKCVEWNFECIFEVVVSKAIGLILTHVPIVNNSQ